MSEKRYLLWLKKSRGKLGSAPKLCTLPPTTEAFELKREKRDDLNFSEAGWYSTRCSSVLEVNGCKTDEPCKKGNCSCKSEQIPCSIFFICQEKCKKNTKLIC